MKSDKFILAVVGLDRPGIIANVSSSLLKMECNIEDDSQIVLNGVFSSTFIIKTIKEIDKIVLERRLLEGAKDLDIEFNIKEIYNVVDGQYSPTIEPFVIIIEGNKIGEILYEICPLIADNNINITNMNSVIKYQSNENDIAISIEVDVPKNLSINKVREKLVEVANRKNFSINIMHKDIFVQMNRI